MPLDSTRFRGMPRLEAIAQGDTSQYLRVGDTGPEVRAVQGALIDHGYAIPAGDTGGFYQETADAVVRFKQARAFDYQDPVVGIETLTALDRLFARPTADRREYCERFGRPVQGTEPARAARPLPQWNFSRFSEQARLDRSGAFSFDPVGVQMPPEMTNAFLAGLEALLRPDGSPDGPYTAPGTWGVSPFDLYHVHLSVDPVALGNPLADWAALQFQYANQIRRVRKDKVHLADGSGYPEGSSGWTQNYAQRLGEPDPATGKTIGQLTEEWLVALVDESRRTLTPLSFVWHSFESVSKRWRPDGMLDGDPRRHWWNVIVPVPTPLVHSPFSAHHGSGGMADLGQLGFLIDQQAQITIMACDLMEVAARHGIAMADIKAADP